MAAEIHSLLHFQNESKIVIHLHKQRNSQPALIGTCPHQNYLGGTGCHTNNTDVVSNLNVGDKSQNDNDTLTKMS